MNKDSNPDWRDQTDWLQNLVTELEQRIKIYDAEPDVELKRNKAAAYMGSIAGHLQEIPPFKGTDLLVPLKDLLIFIHSLESGSGHPWAKPNNFGGTNSETVAETEVRIWVVMGVWSLLEGGYRKNQAYKYMANAMTESGRTSKGRPFSHRNVQRWWLDYEFQRDDRLAKVQGHIENYWAEMPCPHGQLMFHCTSNGNGIRCANWRLVAEEFASNALKVANFRDWFVSR